MYLFQLRNLGQYLLTPSMVIQKRMRLLIMKRKVRVQCCNGYCGPLLPLLRYVSFQKFKFPQVHFVIVAIVIIYTSVAMVMSYALFLDSARFCFYYYCYCTYKQYVHVVIVTLHFCCQGYVVALFFDTAMIKFLHTYIVTVKVIQAATGSCVAHMVKC